MAATNGRGRGRGRGRGGRGSRGGRGGIRGGGGAGGGSTSAPNPVNGRKAPGRRGRGRGRKVEDPRIEALKARKLDLQAQFKSLYGFQKEALCVLAEKSKMKLEGDGKYHEGAPEFEVVMSKLKRRREEQDEDEDRFYEMRKAFLKSQLETTGECIRMQYDQTLIDVKENNIAWLKEKMMYLAELHRQGKEYPGDDVIPFQYGEDGRKVIDLFRPKRIVHQTGTPYNHVPQPSWREDGEKPNHEMGDAEWAQHPANWWKAQTAAEREKVTAFEAKNVELDKNGYSRKIGGNKGKNSLTGAAWRAAQTPQDFDEDDEAQVEQAPVVVEPKLAGPAQVSDDEDAPPYALDKHGVSVPRKVPAPNARRLPSNRIVMKRTVRFEDKAGQVDTDGNPCIEEIGIRKVYTKTIGQYEIVLGKDPSPNPENFYLDQKINGYNSAIHTEDDLDQDLVKEYGLHPRFGIPLPTSENPDYKDSIGTFTPPANWSEPLPRTKPTMLIEDLSTGEKEIYRTQRSWQIRTEALYADMSAKNKMLAMLTAHQEKGEWVPEKVPVLSRAEEIEGEIAQDLVEAVMAGNAQELERRGTPAPTAPSTPKTPTPLKQQLLPNTPLKLPPQPSPLRQVQQAPIQAPPPPPPAPVATEGQRYDPVRDTYQTYQTPYTPMPQARAPPPLPMDPYGGGNSDNLSYLADTMEMVMNGYGAPAPPPPAMHFWNGHAPIPAQMPQPLWRGPPPQVTQMPPPPPPHQQPQMQQNPIQQVPPPPPIPQQVPQQMPRNPLPPHHPHFWDRQPAIERQWQQEQHQRAQQQQYAGPEQQMYLSPQRGSGSAATKHRMLAPAPPQRQQQAPIPPAPQFWDHRVQGGNYQPPPAQ